MTDLPSPPPPPPPPPATPATPIHPALLPAPPADPNASVSVERVSKWFGGVVAVSEVTFSVGAGVTAVLGPNGAGKSTLLRLLCGLTPPSQGTVRIHGRDPAPMRPSGPASAWSPSRRPCSTGTRHWRSCALPRPCTDSTTRRPPRAALEVVELDPDDPRRIATYSKGMRQRVKVAAALVHDPDVLVLDEPLTGLDPRQRRHLIDLFHRLGETERCVLVSSHVLDEVERFGSNVLVIAKGRLAATGDFRAIRDLMDDRPHRLRLGTDKPGALAGALLGAGTVMGVQLTGDDTVLVETTDVARFRALVARVAVDQGAHLREVAPLDDDLDSVFRYLVGGR